MMKEKVEPMDLTQMTDDEIRYIGKEFLSDLIKVLEKHESFYMTQQKYRYLGGTLICAKQQLKREEQEAA